MPQLVPDPWFYVFILSWLTIIIIAPKNILHHKMLNHPTSKTLNNNLLDNKSNDWLNDWS